MAILLGCLFPLRGLLSRLSFRVATGSNILSELTSSDRLILPGTATTRSVRSLTPNFGIFASACILAGCRVVWGGIDVGDSDLLLIGRWDLY